MILLIIMHITNIKANCSSSLQSAMVPTGMSDVNVNFILEYSNQDLMAGMMIDEELNEVENREVSDALRMVKSPDHLNSSWLSSGNASFPSFCFEDYRCSSCSGLQICIHSPSAPPMIVSFDGSKLNPIKEASLVLDRTTFLVDEDDEDDVISQYNMDEEEVVSWLVSENEPADAEPCGTTNFTKLSLFHSENKDSKLVFDNKSKSACSLTDLCETSSVSLISDSSDEHSPFSSSDDASEIIDLEECDIDDPLFWPSDSISDLGSDSVREISIMLPCKVISKIRFSPNTTPDAPNILNGQMDSELECKQRLTLHSRSTSSSSLYFKNENGTKGIRRTGSMPSRLKDCSKTNCRDGDTRKLAGDNNLSVDNHKVFLQDLLLAQKLDVESGIESILGLDEFDGHEGIESEFNKDDFSLDVIM